MQWSEVCKLYPDQWVLVEELKSYEENNKIFVEEVSVIKPIPNSKEAMDELMNAKDDRFCISHLSRTD